MIRIRPDVTESTRDTEFSFVSAEGAGFKETAKCTVHTVPLPNVTFYKRVNCGTGNKKMTVQVSCGKAYCVLPDNNVFQLKDQTGAVLAEKTWKDPREPLMFSFDATEEHLGRHDLSVWLGDYQVSETEFGTVYNASQKAIERVSTDEPFMSVTLDCNWYNSHGNEILDVLDKYGVKATFFMTGNYMRLFPETVDRIIASGHEIGTHTNTHMRQTELGEFTQLREIMIPCETMNALWGIKPRFFRPPYGAFNGVTLAVARSMGMEQCMWTIDSNDWRVDLQTQPEKIISRVTHGVTPGTIILFHMDGYHTAEVLDQVIPFYQQELGLQCVPVGELIRLENRELPPLPVGTYDYPRKEETAD